MNRRMYSEILSGHAHSVIAYISLSARTTGPPRLAFEWLASHFFGQTLLGITHRLGASRFGTGPGMKAMDMSGRPSSGSGALVSKT